jgi:Zn-dependent protease
MTIEIIAIVLIIIISVVIHELAHGYMALFLGDPTAKYAGRLTMNPIKHMDFLGSFLIPAILAMLPGGFIFGWAKPVPYNPYNLKNQRWGELLVAIAGPIANLIVAFAFAMLIRFGIGFELSQPAINMIISVIMLNISLAVFNMFPFPPLDGSKVLFSLLPRNLLFIKDFLERYSLILFLVFLLTVGSVIFPIVEYITLFLIGF